MQSRLFERLGNWTVMEAGPLKAELAKLEGRVPEDYTDEDIGAARELFAKALETPGGLRIETIHAFCGRLLRRFPLEAGIAPVSTSWTRTTPRSSGTRRSAPWGGVVAGEKALVDAARFVAEAGGGRVVRRGAQLPRRAAIERFVARQAGSRRR